MQKSFFQKICSKNYSNNRSFVKETWKFALSLYGSHYKKRSVWHINTIKRIKLTQIHFK